MAKLTAAQRKAMPASEFAGKGRSYPINDRTHAIQAERMVGRGVKAGHITPAQAAAIKAKARQKLGEGKADARMDKPKVPTARGPLTDSQNKAVHAKKHNPGDNLGAYKHPPKNMAKPAGKPVPAAKPPMGPPPPMMYPPANAKPGMPPMIPRKPY